MEEWRMVVSLSLRYEVSSQAKIRNSRTKKVLKQFLSKHTGYLHLSVRPETNKQIDVRVHQIVAEAFIGHCPEGLVVNHIDGVKTNNLPHNLEYTTSGENNRKAYEMGLKKANVQAAIKRGEDSYRASVTECDVRAIKALRRSGLGPRKICKLLDLTKGVVEAVLYRNRWSHIK